jgi:signal transduction histidine kinase
MGSMMSQRIRLADGDGNLLVDTSGGALPPSLTQDELKNSTPLHYQENIVGYLVALGGIGSYLQDEQFLLRRINLAAFIAMLVAGGFSLVIALVLAYRLMLPVRVLTQATRRMAQGDLDARVPVHGEDEIAELGTAFNQMADSIQLAERSRRATTADIAHELRTPLAVQRASLEALQDGIYPPTSENLGSILEQNQLLTRLVDDLRTLAMADAGQLTLEKIPTDLPALVRGMVERFQLNASEGKVQLSFHSFINSDSPPSMIMVDPTRIEQILNNLLSNALRYTPPAGEINVSVGYIPGSYQVTVRDTGPGIPAESLPYVFERFYRADKARSRAEGGTGLGLTIARQLARLHSGDLTVANHPQGGAVFTLSLPT